MATAKSFCYSKDMFQEIAVIVAVILAVIGNVPYLRDVIAGKVQPHPYTWFIWSIVSAVTFFGAVQKGAGLGAIPTGVAELFTIVIFLFSLKYGFKNINKRDNIYLAVALLGLIPWILTKDPTLSVVIVVCIDLVAFIPTLEKARRHPETENPLLFSMNALRHILTLFSLGSYNIATTLHSIVMIVVNTLMTYFILRKRPQKSMEN